MDRHRAAAIGRLRLTVRRGATLRDSAGRWVAGLALATAVAALAHARRLLTLDGALAAVGVGVVVFARGGRPATAALLTFFASSSALSRIGEQRKRRSPLAQAKGARRDMWQVLANGGVASLCVAIGGRRGRAGYLGALAAAGADTWATEIGLLARRSPRLITTLRPVEPGTSGGVTPEGLLASVAGAAAVGLASLLFGAARGSVGLAIAAGTFGALADSLLGATVQGLYRCPNCGKLSEAPAHAACDDMPAHLVHGWPWMNNDTVNALATLAGAAAGAALG